MTLYIIIYLSTNGWGRTARAWALQTQYKNPVQINFLNILREFWLHIRILRKMLRQNMSGQFYSTIIFAGAAATEEVHEENMAHFLMMTHNITN